MRLQPARQALQETYDLTPRQADLAACLAFGQSLKQYSEQAGISFNTARTLLKQVFFKTDTHHQGQLISVTLRGPARNNFSGDR